MPSRRTQLAQLLRQRATEIRDLEVVAGFDGFVDEMISVVEERQGLDRFVRVETVSRFAELMAAAAGRSSLREVVLTSVDPGGCAVNLGDGLAALGLQLDAFATLGRPRHPAFDAFAARCRSCTSWGTAYGRTMALEFSDGKYMLCATGQLVELDERLLDQVLADGSFLAACRRARLIALTNWTLYPHMTAVWRKLQREVFGKLSHRPTFFIDLVDPRSRSHEDLKAMLSVLSGFEACGPTVLGGNLNEANAVAGQLGLPSAVEDPRAVQDQAAAIRARLGIAQVSTHCLKIAAAAEAQGTAAVEGPYCGRPRKSVGAGDRFNAGYCLGQMLGLSLEDRLLLGVTASGWFVRFAASGSINDLAGFLERWDLGREQ